MMQKSLVLCCLSIWGLLQLTSLKAQTEKAQTEPWWRPRQEQFFEYSSSKMLKQLSGDPDHPDRIAWKWFLKEGQCGDSGEYYGTVAAEQHMKSLSGGAGDVYHCNSLIWLILGGGLCWGSEPAGMQSIGYYMFRSLHQDPHQYDMPKTVFFSVMRDSGETMCTNYINHYWRIMDSAKAIGYSLNPYEMAQMALCFNRPDSFPVWFDQALKEAPYFEQEHYREDMLFASLLLARSGLTLNELNSERPYPYWRILKYLFENGFYKSDTYKTSRQDFYKDDFPVFRRYIPTNDAVWSSRRLSLNKNPDRIYRKAIRLEPNKYMQNPPPVNPELEVWTNLEYVIYRNLHPKAMDQLEIWKELEASPNLTD